MKKMDGKTKDIVAENVSKLKELFPEVCTEGKVNFNALREVLGEYLDEREERYSFSWNGKRKARMLAQTPSTGTLRPCREESVDWDSTQNIFIEGDNLEVLKILQKSYYKKVKMIYIDPPYNTGNDFVYKDDFKDNIKNYKKITGQIDGNGNNLSNNPETSGRYHTDWLNMMYPRLKLARNLLKEDGIIFISIDDNEIGNLKSMCNEIFGEENFLNQIVLENDSRARPYGSVATTHEYIISYSKNTSFLYQELRNEEKKFRYHDEDGGFDLYELRNRNVAFNIQNRPNLYYAFWVNPNKKDENNLYEVSLRKHDGWIEVYPQESQGVKTVWRWGKDKAQSNLNSILFGKKTSSETGFQIVKKYRENTYTLNTVWADKGIKTDKGTLETKALFSNKKLFDFPKPVELLHRLLLIGADEESVVLDFFAGSSTTANALMELNALDDGARNFIMVQFPEPCPENSEAFKGNYKTIAEISKERIRRSAAKIKKDNPEHDGDLGFKVFVLDSTNINAWEVESDVTEQDLINHIPSIKADRSEEDVLYEVLLKCGLDLTVPIMERSVAGQRVFDISAGTLIVCLSDNIPLEVAEGIVKLKDELNPETMRVLFRDSGFKDDVVKTNTVLLLQQAGIHDVRSI